MRYDSVWGGLIEVEQEEHPGIGLVLLGDGEVDVHLPPPQALALEAVHGGNGGALVKKGDHDKAAVLASRVHVPNFPVRAKEVDELGVLRVAADVSHEKRPGGVPIVALVSELQIVGFQIPGLLGGARPSGSERRGILELPVSRRAPLRVLVIQGLGERRESGLVRALPRHDGRDLHWWALALQLLLGPRRADVWHL